MVLSTWSVDHAASLDADTSVVGKEGSLPVPLKVLLSVSLPDCLTQRKFPPRWFPIKL